MVDDRGRVLFTNHLGLREGDYVIAECHDDDPPFQYDAVVVGQNRLVIVPDTGQEVVE